MVAVEVSRFKTPVRLRHWQIFVRKRLQENGPCASDIHALSFQWQKGVDMVQAVFLANARRNIQAAQLLFDHEMRMAQEFVLLIDKEIVSS